jgi:hypothetical protein
VCPEAVLLGVLLSASDVAPICDFFAVDQGQQFVTVAGRAAKSYTLYGAELLDGAGLARGDLLQVRVVEHDVGGHLLLFCLLAPPTPQPLEKHRVHPWGVILWRQMHERRHERRPEGHAGP